MSTVRLVIPPEWKGQTCAIFGGGPSLSPVDRDYVIERGWKRIACNDAGLVFDPYAEVMAFGDPRWFTWNREELHRHQGQYRIHWKKFGDVPGVTLHRVRQRAGIVSHDPSAVCCNNTGAAAINIAYLFGATRIVLFGFDMRPVDGKNNWHDRHQLPTKPQVYTGEKPVSHCGFIPLLTQAAKVYKERGIEVINCTPYSALTCFPYQNIRDIH